MYKAGLAKEEITYFKENAGLLGYMVGGNVAKSVATPLFSRACVIGDNSGNLLAIVVAELGFITELLKHKVLAELEIVFPGRFAPHNLLLTAQHSHSTVGGCAQFFMHNSVSPGYREDAAKTYAMGITKSIVAAFRQAEQVSLQYSIRAVSDSADVAFNRSFEAYNRNPEVTEKVDTESSNFALDRRMKQLEIRSVVGDLIGVINWFGVHCTSVGNKNTAINADNKGFAAELLEGEIRKRTVSRNRNRKTAGPKRGDFVAMFMQDIAGDVTPNFIYSPKKEVKKRFANDLEKAKYNGTMQFEAALDMIDNPDSKGQMISGAISTILEYRDLTNVAIEPEFCEGQIGKTTSSPCMGVAALKGTVEGPAMPQWMGGVNEFMNNGLKFLDLSKKKKEDHAYLKHLYENQFPKSISVDGGGGRVVGYSELEKIFIPGFVDVIIKNLKAAGNAGYADFLPWLPTTLPAQLVQIGQLVLAGLPGEITTIAGRRLRNTISRKLDVKNADKVLICSYSNAYSAYTTTFEEYQEQAYEGGHTLYGKYTLAAWQTVFNQLAEKHKKKDYSVNADPYRQHVRPLEQIWKFEETKEAEKAAKKEEKQKSE